MKIEIKIQKNKYNLDDESINFLKKKIIFLTTTMTLIIKI